MDFEIGGLYVCYDHLLFMFQKEEEITDFTMTLMTAGDLQHFGGWWNYKTGKHVPYIPPGAVWMVVKLKNKETALLAQVITTGNGAGNKTLGWIKITSWAGIKKVRE